MSKSTKTIVRKEVNTQKPGGGGKPGVTIPVSTR
jgi:hypothetical protein